MSERTNVVEDALHVVKQPRGVVIACFDLRSQYTRYHLYQVGYKMDQDILVNMRRENDRIW